MSWHRMAAGKTYFVADVHLGLQAFNPQGREQRFVNFLRSIDSPETSALYLLGDIWDFWYEWDYVVPKGYIRVLGMLQKLIDNGIAVYFFPGNHDIWAYSYFEQMGMKKMSQPAFVTIGGKTLCLGHGDGLGGGDLGYRILNRMFKNRTIQKLFSKCLHPDRAMKMGHGWSKGNRLARGEKYIWKGESEPLVGYCRKVLKERHVDLFIFGHYHVCVKQKLSPASELVVLDSWIDRDSVFCIEAEAQS